MTDHTGWYEINAHLGVAASLVNNQLLDNEPLPLALVGGFFHSAASLAERYEALIIRVGRASGAQLPAEALDGRRPG